MNIRKRLLVWGIAVLVGTLVGLLPILKAQNAPIASAIPVQPTQGLYYSIPISATAAVGSPAVLSIPTPPPNQYSYVCSLALNENTNGTGGVLTNVVTTSANFGGFALKFSNAGAANTTYDWSAKWGEPSTGCAKSVSPGTQTTFTSPTTTNSAYVWYATYYNAP